MKRIFTKPLSVPSLTTTGGQINSIAVAYVAEEDITIIAVRASLEVITTITMNGYCVATQELTQAGASGQPGQVFRQRMDCLQWNAAAGGGLSSIQNDNIVFPEGYGITVKEEGSLNIFQQVETPAGETANVHPEFTIYYVKG